MTTRALGDVKNPAVRAKLRDHLPADPVWLKQVHGTRVIDAAPSLAGTEADAAATRAQNVVCAVMAADCMPVLLTDEEGTAVAAAHAGWRGLSSGVIEAALDALGRPAANVMAWLGPAIGPRAYEVGEDVRTAFLNADDGAADCFMPTRPGHWYLDLYRAARRRLNSRGVSGIYGGNFCTASDAARFYSWRRDQAPERMAALVWLT
jgi:YfiH family protein